MTADQLKRQPVIRIEPSGVLPHAEPSARRLVVWGIHGGSDYVTGLVVGDKAFTRLPPDPITGGPGESVDEMRVRAGRNLPDDPLRDPKGSAIGYFTYDCLPDDYCKGTAHG